MCFSSCRPQSPISSTPLSTGTTCTFSSVRLRWSTPPLARWVTHMRPDVVMFMMCVHWQVEWRKVTSLHMQTTFLHVPPPPPCWLWSGIVLYKQCDVLIGAVTCKEVFSCRPLRWFSPESRVFVRMTTAVHRECWSVTGRRSSKPGWTAPSPATPSSTSMFCSRWRTCCRSTTGRPCSASSPRRPTGGDRCCWHHQWHYYTLNRNSSAPKWAHYLTLTY